jgi:hypothetical protein
MTPGSACPWLFAGWVFGFHDDVPLKKEGTLETDGRGRERAAMLFKFFSGLMFPFSVWLER